MAPTLSRLIMKKHMGKSSYLMIQRMVGVLGMNVVEPSSQDSDWDGSNAAVEEHVGLWMLAACDGDTHGSQMQICTAQGYLIGPTRKNMPL